MGRERPKPSQAQQVGHSIATRGMDKSKVKQGPQLFKPRTPQQTHKRYERLCVRCCGPRDSTYPICDACSSERER